MIDPNFDPLQELIDLRVEVEMLRANQRTLVLGHNRLNHKLLEQIKYLQELQQDLAELRHKS